MPGGVVLLNESSGPEAITAEQIQRLIPGARVVAVRPDEAREVAVKLVAGGPEFIAVAGGDGTLRTVAELLVGTGIALLPIPAGTHNHFAKQMGIPDLEAVGRAVSGQTRAVDVGVVNDRCFLNNSSVGLYPRLVRTREAHQRRLPKWAAQVSASWTQLRRGRKIRLSVDGEPYVAWMLFVGNGQYGDTALTVLSRETLCDGLLDVRLVRADRRLARTRLVLATLLGRLNRSPLIVEWSKAETTIEAGQAVVEVALDGEVQLLDGPLRYRCRALALEVRVPATGPPAA